ncbi:HNH endonuclease [Streptosporangium sp. NPDC000509]|uniref:HNH endonuclease n=1 Tax=Streptosporangium sp. NPDC000509 TaxID=3366186 RepID=UPI0036824662
MPNGRPAIPAQLKNDLLIEAGHRCAIPACRAAEPLEFEHINDWAKVGRHEFHNMIVLCRNCHGRKGSGPGKIDRKALRQYKANLAVVNGRYGDLERRILDYVAENPEKTIIGLPPYIGFLLLYLKKDGFIKKSDPKGDFYTRTQGVFSLEVPITQFWEVTEAGREFVERWKQAQPLI